MNASPIVAFVRRWVELYTRGLPAELRTARRDEIDDDLWSQREEATATGRSTLSLGTEMVLRLLLGMPADVSWRFANRRTSEPRARVEMSSSISVRIFGALAVLAGTGWTVMMLLYTVLGMSAWTGPTALFMVIFVVVGGLAFAAATFGLLWRFQEQLHYLGAVGGALAGLGAIASAVNGAWAILLLPAGSAALAWDLGRLGVLPRPLATLHVLTAVLAIVPLVVAFAIGPEMGLSLLGLLIPYPLSWIAIGASLLRGVPRVAGKRQG